MLRNEVQGIFPFFRIGLIHGYTKILVSKKTEATSLTFNEFPINLPPPEWFGISKSINHLLDLCSSFIRQICEHFAKSVQNRSPLGRILTAFFEQFASIAT